MVRKHWKDPNGGNSESKNAHYALFKNVNIIKDKERPRNHFILKETKET